MIWDSTSDQDYKSMKPIERACRLRKEADEVLQKIRLAELVKPWGAVTPTGSYVLDVMAYPDLDLMVPLMPVKAFIEIGAALAENDAVDQVVFKKTHKAVLPGALYLSLCVENGSWGRPWKVDILSLDEESLQYSIDVIDGFCRKITPFLREKIVEYKHAVMTSDERTPPSSGYYIYRAFLDEGLVDFPDVTDYLDKNGIKIY